MSVQIAGVLLDPYGEIASFAEIKFITTQGAGEVMTTAPAVYKTSADGSYSMDIQFGVFIVQMRYNQSNGKFQQIKKVIVNSNTVATTLGELLLNNEPLTPPEIAYVEQLVAEAKGYRDESEAFAIASEVSAQASEGFSQDSSGYADNANQSAIDAANSAALIAPIPLNGGVWASGQTYDFYNQYMIYNGEAYSPFPATTLPYTVGSVPDLGFVYQVKLNSLQALSGLTESSNLDTVHTRAFGSVASMVSFTGHAEGNNIKVINAHSEATYKVDATGGDVFLGGGLWAKKTATQDSKSDLSFLFNNSRSIVIAGDSLSYNAYGWPAGNPALGGYAYENAPGLMAWSHMLRDYCQRLDGNFVHAQDLAYTKTGTSEVNVNPAAVGDKWYLPFNNMFAKIVGKSQTDVVRVLIPNSEPSQFMRFHCVNAGAGLASIAGKVDVRVSTYPYTAFIDKGTITTGGRTPYIGLEPFYHDIGGDFSQTYPVIVEFHNFRLINDAPPAASGVGVVLSAITKKFTDFRLTGHGGYTAAQVLAEVDTMIANYAPDLTMLILGANDRGNGITSAQFIATMTQIVAAIRAANPTSEIVFMSTTPASDSMFQEGVVFAGETITEWLDAVKVGVTNLGCRYFDTFNLFKHVDALDWRFDNIHMNPSGNEILMKALVGEYFSASADKDVMFFAKPTSDMQAAIYQTLGGGKAVSDSGSAIYQFASGTLSYTLTTELSGDAVVRSVTRKDAFTLRVETNVPVKFVGTLGNGHQKVTQLKVESIGQFGAASIWLKPAEIGDNFIEYYMVDISVSPPAVITDLQNDAEKYLVTWS